MALSSLCTCQAEAGIQDSGLHFYLTKDPNQLPESGPHVVAVFLQEERCKIPAYALHVRAVVRNLHSTPFLGFSQLRLNRLNAVLAFEYARDWPLHHRSRRALRTPHPDWPQQLHTTPRIYTIPLGYHSQEELPQTAMQDRTLDSFFAGELATILAPTTYRYWVSTSKAEARKQPWRVLQQLKRDPEWHIDLDNIGVGESVSRAAQFNTYSQKMMNSRICLAPRGSMAETFRLYEGQRRMPGHHEPPSRRTFSTRRARDSDRSLERATRPPEEIRTRHLRPRTLSPRES